MLRNYLEQRHIDLDSGRSCLALEREYWQALEVLAYEDGWNNWRDFFYMRVLPDKPEDISLASHVRKMVTVFLFNEFDEQRSICKSQLRSGHGTGKSKCNRLRSI
jgi:predicted DNA-binding ribbon-helix-helix protein